MSITSDDSLFADGINPIIVTQLYRPGLLGSNIESSDDCKALPR